MRKKKKRLFRRRLEALQHCQRWVPVLGHGTSGTYFGGSAGATVARMRGSIVFKTALYSIYARKRVVGRKPSEQGFFILVEPI
jgi:hypothetical protein